MKEDGLLELESGTTVRQVADTGIRIDRPLASWSVHRSREKLFPHPPKASDISQRQIGDCFFLASLTSILHAESDGFSIYNMMRDGRDGWVTVRFFDDELRAHYVKFQKTVPKFVGFGTLYAAGPLWIAMLEKAYAVAKYKTSYETSLRGGVPSDAITMIIGRRVMAGNDEGEVMNFDPFNRGKEIKNLEALFELGLGTDMVKRAVELNNPKAQAYVNGIKKLFFRASETMWREWLAFNTGGHISEKFSTFYRAEGDFVDRLTAEGGGHDRVILRRGVMRQEQFEKWFRAETGVLDEYVVARILAWVSEQNIFPGKRGTGIYSSEDMNTFETLETALQRNQTVTAGTFKEAGTKASLVQGTVGESVSQGLVGSHMYAVLAVTKDERAPNRCWVKLRNPWGQFVRAYVPDPSKPKLLNAAELDISPGKSAPTRTDFVKPDSERQSVVELTRQGIFWVELSDFVKRFSDVKTGAPMTRGRADAVTARA
jgi:hypothetical protein